MELIPSEGVGCVINIAAMIPYLLVWFRLALAPCFLVGYWIGADQRLFIGLLLWGIISDVFDGVLARRWRCATPVLRRLDSNVDTVFYGCATMVGVLLHVADLKAWWTAFLILFLFLIAQNLVNGFRYGRQPSYHMWSGKIWSATMVVALTGLFLDHPSEWALAAVVTFGIYNSIEGMIASLILPKPLTDIPSVFHAIKLANADSNARRN